MRYIEETPVRRRLASTAGGDPLFAHCRSWRFPSFAEKLQKEGPAIPFHHPHKKQDGMLRGKVTTIYKNPFTVALEVGAPKA
jgi:hypothetical protein